MKSCTKCGFMNNDSDNFCKHCGQDLNEFENSLKHQKENFNQQEACINQAPESSVYAQQQNTNANIDAIKQKPKKKRKKIIIPCVSIILVIAIIVITFVLKIPQKYFGDPFVESTVVSVRETTRNNRTSHRNAVLAVILPDKNGSYSYYDKNNLFPILKSNIENGYIYVVTWDKFLSYPQMYMDLAFSCKERTATYKIIKSL